MLNGLACPWHRHTTAVRRNLRIAFPHTHMVPAAGTTIAGSAGLATLAG